MQVMTYGGVGIDVDSGEKISPISDIWFLCFGQWNSIPVDMIPFTRLTSDE